MPRQFSTDSTRLTPGGPVKSVGADIPLELYKTLRDKVLPSTGMNMTQFIRYALAETIRREELDKV